MGRFGNVLLVGGETDLALTAQRGEVVRFYFTNTANTRVFNVALPGARMKLVGGDSGRYEHEEFVDSVILAPSERAVVDVLFDEPGRADARAPDTRSGPIHSQAITVERESGHPRSTTRTRRLRTNPEWVAERARVAPYFDARARQDTRVRRRDGHGRPRGARRLRLPDAPEVVSDDARIGAPSAE